MSNSLNLLTHNWIYEAGSDDWELAVIEESTSTKKTGIAYWRGTYWFAQVAESSPQDQINSNTFVKVLERQGQMLLVSSN